MSDTEEFADLRDIIDANKEDVVFKDDNFDKENDGKLVYQVQSNKGEDNACILEVGRFTETPSILINQFDMSNHIRCLISSCIFNAQELKEVEDKCQFSMIKLLVNYNNGQVLKPMGCLLLNFNCFEHKSNKSSILDYVSTKSDKKAIRGFWSISFHFQEKKIPLEKYKKYLGNNSMIKELMHHLLDEPVQNIINELVKAF